MQITRLTSLISRAAAFLLAAGLAVLSIASAQAQAVNRQPADQRLAVNQVSGPILSRPEVLPPSIQKPAHIKGAPASEGLEEPAPVLASLEEMNDWLITHRRATWQYFEKLGPEYQEKILQQYQSHRDPALLSKNILRTYWQSRR